MIEESKYYSDVMKKHFDKELGMTRKDNEDFENSNEYWICDNYCIYHQDIEILSWCPVGSVLPHREKMPL